MRGNGCPRQARVLLLTLLLLCTAGSGAARAKPNGALDPSFAGDGRAVFAADSFVPRAVVVDKQDRIIIAGYTCEPDAMTGDGVCLSSGKSNFRVARLTPDGGLDAEFGHNGFVTTPIGSGRSQALDVQVMPDGDIVAGGVASLDGRDVFTMAAYTARGDLDPAFGNGGIVLQPIGTQYSAIADIAVGPGGSVLAAGQAVDAAGVPRAAVARFNAFGQLDTAFGTGGSTLSGASPYNYALGMFIGPGGTITTAGIGGASISPDTYGVGTTRLNPSGTPNTSFGTNGAAEQRIGASASFATSIVPAAHNRWIAGGAALEGDGRQVMAVIRGTPAGVLDPSYGVDGMALVPQEDGAVVNDLVSYPDGRVVAVGQAANAGHWSFAEARLTPNGRLDRTWGAKGVVRFGFKNYPVARATAAALQSTGKLVTVGIGCTAGGLDARCLGGQSVLLVARQTAHAGDTLSDTTPPRMTVRGLPHSVTARHLHRKGLEVGVRLSEPARLRIWAERNGHVVAKLTRSSPAARFSVRLHSAAGPGRLKFAVRGTDASGNATVRRFTVTVT